MSGPGQAAASTSAILQELQDLTSLSWDTTVSHDSLVTPSSFDISHNVIPSSCDFSPSPRDVTPPSRDVTPLSRDVTPSSSVQTTSSVNGKIRNDFLKPGLPSHSSTPSSTRLPSHSSTPSSTPLSKRRMSRNVSYKVPKMFFVSQTDSGSQIENHRKMNCKRDVASSNQSEKVAKPVDRNCIMNVNKSVSPLKDVLKKNLISSISRNCSSGSRRSRYFFMDEEDDDVWDPTPSLSFLKSSSNLVTSSPSLVTSSPSLVPSSPSHVTSSPSPSKKTTVIVMDSKSRESMRRSSLKNASLSRRKSRCFFIDEEEDLWDPTPSLSFLNEFASVSPSHVTPSKGHVTSSSNGKSPSDNCYRPSKTRSVSESKKLFFCDPSDISPPSSDIKSEKELKTEILNSSFTSSVSSCDTVLKSERKPEECVNSARSLTEEEDKLDHVPG